MILVSSLVYWAFFLVSLPFQGLGLAIVWALSAPFDPRRALVHRYITFWGIVYSRAHPYWSVRTVGREIIPRRGPGVIVANHASMVDILVIFSLRRQFKWVSKIENFRVPIIGLNLRLAKYVPVRRGDRASVVSMMQQCEHWVERGVPLLFFPEGTRSPDGRLKNFKDGAFQLAKKKNCPVYPVVLHNTAKGLPKHGLIPKEPMDAIVEVLPPVFPADFESAEDLRDRTRELMSQALDRSDRSVAA